MKAFFVEGIGPVLYRWHGTARRMILRVDPQKGPILTIPTFATQEQIRKFLEKNKPWILEKMEESKKEGAGPTIFDETSTFKTRDFSLKLVGEPREGIQMNLQEEVLQVRYPNKVPVSDPKVQDGIRWAIERALKIRGGIYLPYRLHELAKKHGFHYLKASVSSAKKRWGSCSGLDSINLSYHLMRLPDHLIDYVILHELSHTIEKNHGPKFWALMEKVCDGKAQKCDKELNNYHIIIP